MSKPGARPAKAAKTARTALYSNAEKPKRRSVDRRCECKFNAVPDAYLKQTKKWTDTQFGGQVFAQQSATGRGRQEAYERTSVGNQAMLICQQQGSGRNKQ